MNATTITSLKILFLTLENSMLVNLMLKLFLKPFGSWLVMTLFYSICTVEKATLSSCPCDNTTQQTPDQLLWNCTKLESHSEIRKSKGAFFLIYSNLHNIKNKDFTYACKVIIRALLNINKTLTVKQIIFNIPFLLKKLDSIRTQLELAWGS